MSASIASLLAGDEDQPTRKRRKSPSYMGELIRNATSNDPVYSPAVGWGKIAAGAISGFMERQAEDKEAADRKMLAQAVLSMSGVPATGRPAAAGPVAAAPVSGGSDRSDVASLKSALAPMESGGRYDIKGPLNAKYGSPLGKYQIMESNLPSWSQAAVGRVVSPDEFLSTPELQEQIAGHRMGLILDQHGNLQDAASVWHSGRPLAQAKADGARDVNMSTSDYVARTVGRLADRPAPGARETALSIRATDEDPELGFFIPPAPAGPPKSSDAAVAQAMNMAVPPEGPAMPAVDIMGNATGAAEAPAALNAVPSASGRPPLDILAQITGGGYGPNAAMPPPVADPNLPAPALPGPLDPSLTAAVAGAPTSDGAVGAAMNRVLGPEDAPLPPARPSEADLAPPMPLPPARPPDLDPQADMPAPGAREAMLRPPATPDWSNQNDAGAGDFARSGMGNPAMVAAAVRGAPAPASAASPGPPQTIMPPGAVGGPAPGPNGPVAAPAPLAGSPDSARPAGGMTREAALQHILSSPNATPAHIAFALGQLEPKTSHMDLGDAVGIVDQRGNVIARVPKVKMPNYGVVSEDAYGNKTMGWTDPNTRSVTPYRPQGSGDAPILPGQPGSAIPAPPPGVDPKVWRDAQSKAAAADALPVDPKNVAEVRKEVLSLPSYKNVTQAMPVYAAMRDAAGRDTKASDLNLIYGLGKIMDPGSVVREGEMALANGTSGLEDRLIGFAKSVLGGARLQPEVRAALLAEAHSRMKSYEDVFDVDSRHYRGIATRGRMNVDDVVPTFERSKPWEPAKTGTPAKADIEAEMKRRGLR